MRKWRLLFFFLSVTSAVSAQPGGPAWGKQLVRVLGPTAARQTAVVPAPKLERALQTQLLAHTRWKNALPLKADLYLPARSMAVKSSPSILPASEADAYFNYINDQLAAVWQSVTERDIALLQDYKADILKSLHVRLPRQPVQYAALIPPQAKYIAVGEEHGFAPLRQAFEELVLGYRQMYPERKIIVLTEFVFDRTLPLSEKTGEPVSLLGLKYRRVSADFRFLEKFVKRGIDVIGLEDERYFRSHQRLITPVFRQVESVYGMKQRNEHWREIIEQVRRREPEAVFFVYTGNMHVHYRAPYSLVRASSQVFVLQFFAGELGRDLPFGAVMQKEPFARTEGDVRYPTVLSWPQASPYRMLSGFDAGLIFPVSQ